MFGLYYATGRNRLQAAKRSAIYEKLSAGPSAHLPPADRLRGSAGAVLQRGGALRRPLLGFRRRGHPPGGEPPGPGQLPADAGGGAGGGGDHPLLWGGQLLSAGPVRLPGGIGGDGPGVLPALQPHL